jgi:hypothetical protein
MKPRNAPKESAKSLQSQTVTAENYSELSMAFMRGQGGGFVIRSLDGADGALETGKPATEAEWLAWLRYFDQIGVTKAYGRRAGMITVPCRWPEDFDPMAHKSDKTARQPQSPRYAGRIPAAKLRALGDAIRPAKRLSAPRPPSQPKTAEELAREYAARPLVISDYLLEALAKPGGG